MGRIVNQRDCSRSVSGGVWEVGVGGWGAVIDQQARSSGSDVTPPQRIHTLKQPLPPALITGSIITRRDQSPGEQTQNHNTMRAWGLPGNTNTTGMFSSRYGSPLEAWLPWKKVST
ncbi:hypothetical protein JZ751_014585 [Albula glossodonta]|uniref:Uncharacterized protein n=1 Tax=Albula glossodonta TaxID=121402 RepID=A0A8T2N7K5_9TELE|nr:hypothetical protein JZ751_014585 [Albula glossodonta]